MRDAVAAAGSQTFSNERQPLCKLFTRVVDLNAIICAKHMRAAAAATHTQHNTVRTERDVRRAVSASLCKHIAQSAGSSIRIRTQLALKNVLSFSDDWQAGSVFRRPFDPITRIPTSVYLTLYACTSSVGGVCAYV